MRRSILRCILMIIITVFVLMKPTFVLAQKEPGQSVFTAGAGYSIIGLTASLAVNDSGSINEDYVIINPYVVGSYDIGLSKIFSLGLSYATQSFRYYYVDRSIRYTDKYNRSNYALRALFHFGKNESIDGYAGTRLGYTVWTLSTNNTEPKHDIDETAPRVIRVNIKNTHYTAQAIFGFRYFFTKNLGFNWEVSIGPPGFMMAGLNLKF